MKKCLVCSCQFRIDYIRDYIHFFEASGYCSLECYKKSNHYTTELKEWRDSLFTIQQLSYVKDALENHDPNFALSIIDDLIEEEQR